MMNEGLNEVKTIKKSLYSTMTSYHFLNNALFHFFLKPKFYSHQINYETNLTSVLLLYYKHQSMC